MDSTKTFGRIEKNLNKFSKLNVFIHCGKVAERAAPQFKKEYTFFLLLSNSARGTCARKCV